jgi:AhpD family alkylhydroperoxidase
MEMTMTQRLNAFSVAPEAINAMQALSQHTLNSGLEHSLQELVKIRASQINGCANCLHMHTADARKAGESEARIYLLSAWRESQLFTPRERAALGWTEALTLIHETHAPDADYAALQAAFTPKEQVELTLLIGVINTWNRLAVGFRVVHPSDKRSVAAKAA